MNNCKDEYPALTDTEKRIITEVMERLRLPVYDGKTDFIVIGEAFTEACAEIDTGTKYIEVLVDRMSEECGRELLKHMEDLTVEYLCNPYERWAGFISKKNKKNKKS